MGYREETRRTTDAQGLKRRHILGSDMIRLPFFSAGGFAAVILLATQACAQEQPAAPAAPTGADAAPAPPGWIKQCVTEKDKDTGKVGCQTARDLRDLTTGQLFASVAVRDEKAAGKRTISVAVQPGLQIQPGIRLFIDEQNMANARYTICYPTACIVEAEAPDALVSAMKKGKSLVIQAITIQGKVATFPIALPGFAKAYEGEATSAEDFAKIQKDWADKMTAWLKAHPPAPPQAAGAAAPGVPQQ